MLIDTMSGDTDKTHQFKIQLAILLFGIQKDFERRDISYFYRLIDTEDKDRSGGAALYTHLTICKETWLQCLYLCGYLSKGITGKKFNMKALNHSFTLIKPHLIHDRVSCQVGRPGKKRLYSLRVGAVTANYQALSTTNAPTMLSPAVVLLLSNFKEGGLWKRAVSSTSRDPLHSQRRVSSSIFRSPILKSATRKRGNSTTPIYLVDATSSSSKQDPLEQSAHDTPVGSSRRVNGTPSTAASSCASPMRVSFQKEASRKRGLSTTPSNMEASTPLSKEQPLKYNAHDTPGGSRVNRMAPSSGAASSSSAFPMSEYFLSTTLFSEAHAEEVRISPFGGVARPAGILFHTIDDTTTEKENNSFPPYRTSGGYKSPCHYEVAKGARIPDGMRHLNFDGTRFVVPIGYMLERHPTDEGVLLILPSTTRVVNKTQNTKDMKKLDEKKDDDASERLCKIFKKGKFHFNNEAAKDILRCMVAYLPKIPSLAFEVIYSFIMKAICVEARLGIGFDSIVTASPCRQTFDNLVLDLAATSTVLCAKEIAKARVFYVSTDKADGSNGKRGGTTKLLAWYSVEKGEIMDCCLDSDMSGNTSEACANGMAHSLDKLSLEDHGDDVKGGGVTADSGGGATGRSGADALQCKGVLAEEYLMGNCTLHNINLVNCVPIMKVLNGPKSGIDARNALQLIYSGYAMMKYMTKPVAKLLHAELKAKVKQFREDIADDPPDDEDSTELPTVEEATIFEKFIADLNDRDAGDTFDEKKFRALQEGSESRWFSIGVAAVILFEDRLEWIAMARALVKTEKSGSAACKTAQDFLSRASTDTIVSDLSLIACYHKCFMKKHLTWLQSPDPLLKKAGHQSFNILPRVYLMRQDLNDFGDLESNVGLQAFRESLVGLSEEDARKQKAKFAMFVKVAIEEHEKMFQPWMSNMLAFLAAFGEAKIGCIIADVLLERQIDESDLDEAFDSFVHGRKIDLRAFKRWLEDILQPINEVAELPRKDEYISHLEMIAPGNVDIWSPTLTAEVAEAKNEICRKFAAFYSNNQSCERMQKTQNDAAMYHRGDANVCVRLMARSLVTEMST